MKNLFVGLMAMFTIACNTVTPGEVVVAVDQCGSVATEADRYTVIQSGRYNQATPCTDHFSIPLREQRAVWTESEHEGSPNDESIEFSASDGQVLKVDVGIGYQIPVEKVVKMILRYGPNLEKTIDERVRDATRHHLNGCAADMDLKVQDIYGTEKSKLFACVESNLQSEYNKHGLVINQLTLNSGIRLPAKIKDAMERAQAATQEADQARRELEKTKALQEKTLIEAQATADAATILAEGEAQANRIVTASLTPAVLELKRLEIQNIQAQQWDGVLPATIMGGEVPMLMSVK